MGPGPEVVPPVSYVLFGEGVDCNVHKKELQGGWGDYRPSYERIVLGRVLDSTSLRSPRASIARRKCCRAAVWETDKRPATS